MLLLGPRESSPRPRRLRAVTRFEKELGRLEAAHAAASEERRLLEDATPARFDPSEALHGAGGGDRRAGEAARAAHLARVARRREEAYALAVRACRADLASARTDLPAERA
jgi:hypothetical protein